MTKKRAYYGYIVVQNPSYVLSKDKEPYALFDGFNLEDISTLTLKPSLNGGYISFKTHTKKDPIRFTNISKADLSGIGAVTHAFSEKMGYPE